MINASSQNKTLINNRYLVYAVVSSGEFSEQHSLSNESFGAVEFVSTAGIIFAVSKIDSFGEVGNVSAAQITAFSNIVNELHRLTDVLPFRYGATLNLEQMKELAERQGALYQESLKRVEACSEINAHWGVRPTTVVNGDGSTSSKSREPSSGGDYLRRKYLAGKSIRSMEEAASVVAVSLVSEMGSVLKNVIVSSRHINNQSSTKSRCGTQFIVSINLLVRRDAVAQVIDKLRRTKLDFDLPVLVSGPWPAFSFLNEMNVDSTSIDMCQCKGVQSKAA